MLLASCLLLDHLKLHGYASMIRKAILSTITDSQVRFDQCYMQFVGGFSTFIVMSCFVFRHYSKYVISFVFQLHTADLGGKGSTSEMVQSIMDAIQSSGPRTQRH